ncbi:MAG: transposase [Deltaproteobacteria bacterium]|nr:transposase [Deltaproteobacteria bacterium]
MSGTQTAFYRGMSYPQRVLPGSTYLVTRRCTQRQFLLRPSRTTNEILSYCLARAALLYGIELHAYCFLSNHYHLVLTDPGARLPEFMRYLNELSARALNASLGRWEGLWASGTYSAVELVGLEDVVEKIAYTLANPVAAGRWSAQNTGPGCGAIPAGWASPVSWRAARWVGSSVPTGPRPSRPSSSWSDRQARPTPRLSRRPSPPPCIATSPTPSPPRAPQDAPSLAGEGSWPSHQPAVPRRSSHAAP